MKYMETYSLALATKKIYDCGLNLFSLKTLKDILEIEKESTNFSVINRLIKNRVLVKISKDKYGLQNAKIHDFIIANFIYQPSYVSFESALNFYGILSQFPYEITSAGLKKTNKKIIDNKTYTYVHLKKSLFWGYQKKDDFLIALPEKALLDQLYFASKGLKQISLNEYDYSFIDPKRLKEFVQEYPNTKQFNKIKNDSKKYLKL